MKPRGLLTVVGSIDITQFWPDSTGTRSSDGDTVHMKVDPQTSFLFSSSAGAKPKVTKKFIGAYVMDHGKKAFAITSKNEIKIRLQGIDTPELHYPVMPKKPDPSKKGKTDFRQAFGAGAASALHDYLKEHGDSGKDTLLHATFVTRINHPNDALDSHGRFVGDIIVAGKNINTWLVENGWAYPLFYDSMLPTEIRTLVDAWKSGQKIPSRPAKALNRSLLPFNPAMTVSNAHLPDTGKVNFPKIFRRQATFWKEISGPLGPEKFVELLNNGVKGKSDTAYPLDYFLSHSENPDRKKRVKFASRVGRHGEMLCSPPELVFNEDPSTLLSAKGAKVASW